MRWVIGLRHHRQPCNLSPVTIAILVDNIQRNSLISQNLTFIGENHFTPHQEHPLSVTNLDISDQSLQDLNLTINNSLDLKLLSESLGYSYDQEEWPEELTEDSETMSYVKEKAKHIGIFTKDKYEKLPGAKAVQLPC